MARVVVKENENLDDDTIYDLTVQKEKYEISLKYNIERNYIVILIP